MSDTVENKPYGVIYAITNKIDGKVYIGQTINYKKRLLSYKGLRCKGQPLIYNALRKNGIGSFTFEIIDEAVSKVQLDLLEIVYIGKFRSLYKKYGYNLQSGGSYPRQAVSSNRKIGNANRGKTRSDDVKNKMSEDRLGEKNGFYGKKHTPQTKERIGNANKGRIKTKEELEKLAKSTTGKKYALGYVHTIEQRIRKSEAHKGIIPSEESNQKRSKSLMGHVVSYETRRRISETKKKNFEKKKALKLMPPQQLEFSF